MSIFMMSNTHLEMEKNIGQLHSDLECCQSWEDAYLIEQFLFERGIFSLHDLKQEDALAYHKYLTNKNISKTRATNYVVAFRKVHREFLSVQYAELLQEVEDCKLGKAVKNKAVGFLIDNGIKRLAQIDVYLREKYIAYLESHICANKLLEYTKALDRMKLHSIKCQEERFPFRMEKLRYAETKIYLSYYPVYDIAKSFYYVQDKNLLIWDFSVRASGKLKYQIFQVLIYAVENISDAKDRLARYIQPLRWLYEYCITHEIQDLEQLEQSQIEQFRVMVSGKVAAVSNSMQIVDNARKILFLTADKTNWNAVVWYLERFHFSRERMNPSNPVIRMSFLEITDEDNRMLLQEYTKYQIGISNQSLGTIRQDHYYVSQMLLFMEKRKIKAKNATPDDMDKYFRKLDEEEIQAGSYNKKVISSFAFFRYLKSKGKIVNIPFIIEYYLKGVIPFHNNRSVSAETVKTVLHSLKYIPLQLRLMYLHLWCIGLRINEVCTLRGDAYTWRGDSAWLSLYQNKVRTEKRVPIPKVLYQLMVNYISKNGIRPDEYVFKSARGNAYHANTFSKNFVQELKKCGIECDDIDFKSHDYRHTVATFLYSHGASLQAVRDYLGHKNDEMTLQYLDYLPDMAEKANKAYFSKDENSLASVIKRKKRGRTTSGK